MEFWILGYGTCFLLLPRYLEYLLSHEELQNLIRHGSVGGGSDFLGWYL